MLALICKHYRFRADPFCILAGCRDMSSHSACTGSGGLKDNIRLVNAGIKFNSGGNKPSVSAGIITVYGIDIIKHDKRTFFVLSKCIAGWIQFDDGFIFAFH